METIGEIIPFAKEMLNRGHGRGLVKVYMLGTTLAVLGLVAGLVETVCLPFSEQEIIEEGITETPEDEGTEKEQVLNLQMTPDQEEAMDVSVKAKHLVAVRRRSYAS